MIESPEARLALLKLQVSMVEDALGRKGSLTPDQRARMISRLNRLTDEIEDLCREYFGGDVP